MTNIRYDHSYYGHHTPKTVTTRPPAVLKKRAHMVNKRELLVLLIAMLVCMLSTFDEANFIIGNRK